MIQQQYHHARKFLIARGGVDTFKLSEQILARHASSLTSIPSWLLEQSPSNPCRISMMNRMRRQTTSVPFSNKLFAPISIHSSIRTITTDTNEKRVLIKDMGEGIYNIQLNRPKKCNALDLEMFECIAETISTLQHDHQSAGKNMRCIILSGNGRAFCTGLDVPSMIKPSYGGDDTCDRASSMMMMPHTKMKRLLERPSGYDQRKKECENNSTSAVGIGNLAQDVAYLWRTIPIPVIAVLHGMCYGGGMQIALGADIRITTSDCKLSIMEAKWGLIPDMSASITLRELIPIDVAKELTFTGRIINGKEAKELGLVTKCLDDSSRVSANSISSNKSDNVTGNDDNYAMEEAIKLAKEIVKQSPDAVAAAKSLYQKTWIDSNEEQCLDIESRLQKKLLPSWNQFVASSKNFGLKLSYAKQKDFDEA